MTNVTIKTLSCRLTLFILSSLFLVGSLQAGIGGLLKEVAKEAAIEKTKKEVSDAVVGALTKNNPEYQGPKTYDEALAAAAAIPVPASPPIVAIDAGKDMSKLPAYSKMLKQTQRVAVAGFRVAFITSNAASASKNNALSNIGNSAASSTGFTSITQDESVKLQVLLQGVDGALMQQITDEACQQFLAELAQAEGLEVLPLESVLQSTAFAEMELEQEMPRMKKAGMSYPRDTYVYSPSGIPLWFCHADSGIYGTKAPMDLKNWKVLNATSAELGAILLVPQITINFSNVQSTGNHNMISSAKVTSEDAVIIEGAYTSISAYQAEKRAFGNLGMATLKKAKGVGDNYSVRYLVDESDNATLVNTLTRLTGQAGTIHKAETWAVVANPEAYKALALAGTQAVSRSFADLLAQ